MEQLLAIGAVLLFCAVYSLPMVVIIFGMVRFGAPVPKTAKNTLAQLGIIALGSFLIGVIMMLMTFHMIYLLAAPINKPVLLQIYKDVLCHPLLAIHGSFRMPPVQNPEAVLWISLGCLLLVSFIFKRLPGKRS